MKQIINSLLDAVDPDKQMERAKQIFGTDTPTEQQIKKATDELAKQACAPFDSAELRNTIIDIKRRNEQIIDTVSKDSVILAGFDDKAKEKARTIVDTFKKFIEENKDELTALQIIYNKPYGKRYLTYKEIKQLADAMKRPSYNSLTPELVWQAYEKLEKSRVRGAGAQKILTNIISLVRFAIGQSDVLEPFPESVNRRFSQWFAEQEKTGRRFTPTQKQWLEMIKGHIATSASIGIEDFEKVPFAQKGGAVKAYDVFEQELDRILEEMNKVLVA